jgi:hypothetical protein
MSPVCPINTPLKCWAVLWPGLAVIVDPGGGDVGVAEPFLHLGDVGLVIERVRSGGGPKRMGADLKASSAEYFALVCRSCRDRAPCRLVEPAGPERSACESNFISLVQRAVGRCLVGELTHSLGDPVIRRHVAWRW